MYIEISTSIFFEISPVFAFDQANKRNPCLRNGLGKAQMNPA